MGAGDLRSPRIHWPAILTAVRVALVVPVVALTLKRTDASDWVAFGAFALAALTDGLDGWLARRMNLVSKAGQLWDPLADKALVTAAMVALVIVGRFPGWAAAVFIIREVAVTGLRLAASRRGRGFPASKAGKAKTVAQLVSVLLFILPFGESLDVARWAVLAAALALAVGSGIDYFRRAPVFLGARSG